MPPTRNLTRPNGARDLSLLGNCFDHVWRTDWANLKSAKTAGINAKTIVEHYGRHKRLAEITAADIAELKIDLAETGLSSATVNRKVAALSKLLKVAHEAGAIPAMPAIRWNREEKTKYRYLDTTEERVLLNYWIASGHEDMHDLTALLIDTGARCWSEMRPVRWDAFGPNFSSITFWLTKTGKPRTVPLTKRSRAILAQRKKLMPGTLGPFAGLHRSTMVERWRQMKGVLSYEDVNPHTLRHTCCTRLVLGGVDVKRVMEWMGHSSINTTMRYMQLKPSGLEDVLHVLENAG
ncbi:tyrosine-type recombinase/integrase [Devosia psychrophila]|uniref:tyrosine-type recombinase/integrase n=1 Tax=Devosia psychrophila TaxID=728005 RepID=UPI00130D8A51|nr:site-specific integrase [Devosia psychrophila]